MLTVAGSALGVVVFDANRTHPLRAWFECIRTVSMLVVVEPMTGIEPAYSAWEADVLPLNYIGMVPLQDINPGR